MSSSGTLVVYPPSENIVVNSAAVSIPSISLSTETPFHMVSSFDHLVTQWMSLVTVSDGSAMSSFQVHRFGSSISPSMVKVHLSRFTRGVGPADRTGKSVTTYCPGGTRELEATSRRLPRKPREMNPTGPNSRAYLKSAHPVVLRVVLHLGQPKRFEQRRHVHAKAAAQPFLHPVPAADRILGRPAPRLDRAFGRRLLLIRAAERHPVAVLLQHRVQVIDRAQLVAELGLAHDADDRRRAGRLVPVHLVLRRPARSRELPG